ncbi:hypothetical protein ACSLVQ_29335, partial [Klebsiella pneumoniae]|uniref:hypothetical protein n=1 Tax=Klebsiella pneumoniae TaxID=573 RepID=UPI003EE0ADB0
ARAQRRSRLEHGAHAATSELTAAWNARLARWTFISIEGPHHEHPGNIFGFEAHHVPRASVIAGLRKFRCRLGDCLRGRD